MRRRLIFGAFVALIVIPLGFPAYGFAIIGRPDKEETTEVKGKIAFARKKGGDYEIFVMNADGSGLRQVTHNDKDDFSPDWSPDGRLIAYTHCTKIGNTDVHIIRSNGTHHRWLTHMRHNYEYEPSWSPNGKWIAFASEPDILDGGDVDAKRADKSRRRGILSQDENTLNHDPTWSPDGKWIVLVETYDSDALVKVSVCCSKGYKTEPFVIEGEGNATHPDWSPDGSTILFGGDHDYTGDKYDLFIVSAEGGNVTDIDPHPSDSLPGSWSPDGSRIVFYSNRGGSWNIFTIGNDGSDLVQLTDDRKRDLHPDWITGSVGTKS